MLVGLVVKSRVGLTLGRVGVVNDIKSSLVELGWDIYVIETFDLNLSAVNEITA
jgi:hypothetical protein